MIHCTRRNEHTSRELYLQVADIQEALDDGSNQDEADEIAGQAIRALVLLKQRLDEMLEPEPLTAIP